jgi:RraA family protein
MAGLPLAIADLCDYNADLIKKGELRVLQPIFQSYGRRQTFAGPVVTLKTFEDNLLLREFLDENGRGRVLVVDGGGSMGRALIGGILADRAQKNGWAGFVINGCIRDVDDVNRCDIGVRALNSHPMKPLKAGVGEKHISVTIAGVKIYDGDWLYADADGIIISKSKLAV